MATQEDRNSVKVYSSGPLDCYGSHHHQQQQKQHRHDRRGELHLQCYHYHGHRHLRQSKQLHLAYWSGRLTAYRHLLFPDPLHRGSRSPAELLLKPGAHSPLFSASTLFLTSPHPTSPHLTSHPNTPCSPASLRDHKTNMDGLYNLPRPP
ncbi:transcription factor MYB120-like isoform X1 [Archocentrus centrarchus]|uniref:transcription factor MYB120-like isoform X1 n=1 Tax=Archocentrus centrarchus TaxID=63155 RepID=UPI0011EA37DB|nr:transcription factor MYB120-like isoform X1 [Archocentrus centrarchus]